MNDMDPVSGSIVADNVVEALLSMKAKISNEVEDVEVVAVVDEKTTKWVADAATVVDNQN